MDFLVRLNRRHKAALFFTLVAAGVSLELGAGAKQTVGTVLLGLAFAGALGSDSRPVHGLFILCGLLLASGPVLFSWNEHRERSRLYEEQVAKFERKLSFLAKSYPLSLDEKSYRWIADDPWTGGRMGWDGSNWVPIEAAKSSPKWIADAIAAGVNLAALPDAEKPSNQPEPFNLRDELAHGAAPLFVALGILLFCLGLGSLLWVRPKPLET